MGTNYFEIPLNKSKFKKSINKNITVGVDLSGRRRLLPEEPIEGIIDGYETYLNERKNGNKFRLIFNITPFCTNVLFNPITEIVKDEGSDHVKCLNFKSMTKSEFNGDTIGKPSNFVWTDYEAVRDTQLSNNANGFTYHCGANIFNNHILRNKSFKAVNYNESFSASTWDTLGSAYSAIGVGRLANYSAIRFYTRPSYKSPAVCGSTFNTIDDYMRDRHGVPIPNAYHRMYSGVLNSEYLKLYNVPMHLYQFYDVYSFNSCITNKLQEDNGWFGFSNPSIINSQKLTARGSKTETTSSTDFYLSRSRINLCADSSDNVISLAAVTETSTKEVAGAIPEINRTINNKPECEFIDMYPERELFSFTPIYNKYRKRLEKNWDYCLTYPYLNLGSDKVENVDFLTRKGGRKTDALVVDRYDENIIGDDGLPVLTIYSICQHGLKVGDHVNIYKIKSDSESELMYESSEVVTVIDKYIFQVQKESFNISEEWVNLNSYTVSQREDGVDLKGDYVKYVFDSFKMEVRPEAGWKIYKVCESLWVNVDDNAQNLSFVKVVDNVECNYYIRMFRRIPNFKFVDTGVNDFKVNDLSQIESSGDTVTKLVKKYSDPTNKLSEFESHVSKIGFSNTSYGDDVTQIVYTDDIDVSYLKDNLGRPLSEVYLTIVKANGGYREWYGVGGAQNISSETVTYSHCFGRNNAQFLLSDYYRRSTNGSTDVRNITAGGLRGIMKQGFSDDEIYFSKASEFFGDLCCYSPIDCDETRIQNIMGRFNTVQREMNSYGIITTMDKFSAFTYNDIEQFTDENSAVYTELYAKRPTTTYSNVKKVETHGYEEGYYYQMHYRVPIRDVSQSLKYDEGVIYELYSLAVASKNTALTNRGQLNIRTVSDTTFTLNDKIMMYDKEENEVYYITISDIFDSYTFTATVADEKGKDAHATIKNIIYATSSSRVDLLDRFVLVKRHEDTPSYAKIVKDGSCRYYWREIVSNGIEDDNIVYPFTNGAFYISTPINFFLRRQDPYHENLAVLESSVGTQILDYTPAGEIIEKYEDYDIDTSYDSDEIDDCEFNLSPLKDNQSNSKISNTINTVASFFK